MHICMCKLIYTHTRNTHIHMCSVVDASIMGNLINFPKHLFGIATLALYLSPKP